MRQIRLVGFQNYDRILFFGVVVSDENVDEEELELTFVDWTCDEPRETTVPYKYLPVSPKDVLASFYDDDILVKNTYVGEKYLKMAVEFILLAEDYKASWKRAIRDGIVTLYCGEPGGLPVLVLGDYYGALIAPRILDV